MFQGSAWFPQLGTSILYQRIPAGKWGGSKKCVAGHIKAGTVTKRNKTISELLPHKADPTERSWRGVLRGHVPSKSLSADSEIPAPLLLGARRRWVRKATAFRGRSEQDRSALVSRLLCSDFENIPVECFQRDFPFLKLADTARRVPTNISPKHLASCAQLEQPFRGSGSEIVLFLHDAFCIL